MNTWTVAYVTQMVSSTAVMAGDRHQGSLRSVFSDICARVLAGATDACVIVRRLRPGKDSAAPARGKAPRAGAGVASAASSNETLFPWISPRGTTRCVWACDSYYNALPARSRGATASLQ